MLLTGERQVLFRFDPIEDGWSSVRRHNRIPTTVFYDNCLEIVAPVRVGNVTEGAGVPDWAQVRLSNMRRTAVRECAWGCAQRATFLRHGFNLCT